jgi:hypothetical protein
MNKEQPKVIISEAAFQALEAEKKDPFKTTEATLIERGSRYGSFKGHAEVTQDFKNLATMHLASRNKRLSTSQQEALDMIFHKIGRILNGDPNYADSWHDIAGYASLVDKELNNEII